MEIAEESVFEVDGTRYGTIYEFDDEPVSAAYDASGEEADLLVFNFEDRRVFHRCEHDVVKLVADDDMPPLTTAVALSPEASSDIINTVWLNLHPMHADGRVAKLV